MRDLTTTSITTQLCCEKKTTNDRWARKPRSKKKMKRNNNRSDASNYVKWMNWAWMKSENEKSCWSVLVLEFCEEHLYVQQTQPNLQFSIIGFIHYFISFHPFATTLAFDRAKSEYAISILASKPYQRFHSACRVYINVSNVCFYFVWLPLFSILYLCRSFARSLQIAS